MDASLVVGWFWLALICCRTFYFILLRASVGSSDCEPTTTIQSTATYTRIIRTHRAHTLLELERPLPPSQVRVSWVAVSTVRYEVVTVWPERHQGLWGYTPMLITNFTNFNDFGPHWHARPTLYSQRLRMPSFGADGASVSLPRMLEQSVAAAGPQWPPERSSFLIGRLFWIPFPVRDRCLSY